MVRAHAAAKSVPRGWCRDLPVGCAAAPEAQSLFADTANIPLVSPTTESWGDLLQVVAVPEWRIRASEEMSKQPRIRGRRSLDVVAQIVQDMAMLLKAGRGGDR